MRLWSLHPKYLDTKWLLACWREWLLARNVLLWITKWYKNHPQLDRFKASIDPIKSIDAFLTQIYLEANNRWYSFDYKKLGLVNDEGIINVNEWQVIFEFKHLLNKLQKRDKNNFIKYSKIKNIEVNPIFNIIEWNIEKWEKGN